MIPIYPINHCFSFIFIDFHWFSFFFHWFSLDLYWLSMVFIDFHWNFLDFHCFFQWFSLDVHWCSLFFQWVFGKKPSQNVPTTRPIILNRSRSSPTITKPFYNQFSNSKDILQGKSSNTTHGSYLISDGSNVGLIRMQVFLERGSYK